MQISDTHTLHTDTQIIAVFFPLQSTPKYTRQQFWYSLLDNVFIYWAWGHRKNICCQKIFYYSFSFQATDMVFTAKWDRILIFCFVVSWMMNRLEEAFDFNLWCVYHPWTLDVHCNCSGGSSRLCNKLIMLVWKMIFRVLWRSGQIKVKTGWLGEVCTLHIPNIHSLLSVSAQWHVGIIICLYNPSYNYNDCTPSANIICNYCYFSAPSVRVAVLATEWGEAEVRRILARPGLGQLC